MPRLVRHFCGSLPLLLATALAACAPAPTATPPLSVAPTAAAQAATPAPSASFDDLPQRTTAEGFPQVGYDNAPVSVVIYTAFDDPASAAAWASTAPVLAARARAGEILITTLPQFGEGIPNARGAARAAACAGLQSAYYRYAGLLFPAALAEGSAAFDGARLIDLANRAGLDRSQWDACMISDQPDRILDEAKRAAGQTTLFEGTPLVLVNSLASRPDGESLDFTIDRAVAEFGDTLARALTPEATLDAEATPEIEVTVEPLLDGALQPPITLALPEGWSSGIATMLIEDFDGPRGLPVAVYSGPVTGGEGTIVLLWGFPNVVSPDPAGGELRTDLHLDGLRLLRTAVVEAGCNIGTDLRRDDTVGGLAAAGTTFAAVDCPELPDTRGWFAGLRQNDLNFVFYAFAEPIEAMDGPADAELRAILDSVQFLPVPRPTATFPPSGTLEAGG